MILGPQQSPYEGELRPVNCTCIRSTLDPDIMALVCLIDFITTRVITNCIRFCFHAFLVVLAVNLMLQACAAVYAMYL